MTVVKARKQGDEVNVSHAASLHSWHLLTGLPPFREKALLQTLSPALPLRHPPAGWLMHSQVVANRVRPLLARNWWSIFSKVGGPADLKRVAVARHWPVGRRPLLSPAVDSYRVLRFMMRLSIFSDQSGRTAIKWNKLNILLFFFSYFFVYIFCSDVMRHAFSVVFHGLYHQYSIIGKKHGLYKRNKLYYYKMPATSQGIHTLTHSRSAHANAPSASGAIITTP